MWTRTFLLVVLLVAGCFAQNEPAKAGAAPPAEPKFFRLDFVVKELESGKLVNSRAYTMTVATGGPGDTEVRASSRLPVPNAPAPPEKSDAAFNYVSVGTHITCRRTQELGNRLSTHVAANVSTAVTEPGAPAPVIRQVNWSSPVMVQLGKPTTIFSSDDPTSKRQMQLELTARPIK